MDNKGRIEELQAQLKEIIDQVEILRNASHEQEEVDRLEMKAIEIEEEIEKLEGKD